MGYEDLFFHSLERTHCSDLKINAYCGHSVAQQIIDLYFHEGNVKH